jgi:hypothetical protein
MLCLSFGRDQLLAGEASANKPGTSVHCLSLSRDQLLAGEASAYNPGTSGLDLSA